MKKSLIILLALGASSVALAGNTNGCQGNCPGGDTVNNNNQTYNQGGAGGTGIGVGVGIAGAASNASASVDNRNTNANTNLNTNSVRNDVSNTNLQGQQQGQGQMQGQGQQQSNTGSVSGSNSATGSGNVTSIKSEVQYHEAAQAAAAYAPQIPTVAVSCRLYISIGGAGSSTSTTASASGGIPIGNDQTCLTVNALKVMASVNAAGRQVFTAEDFRMQACKMEGMAETEGCKGKPAAKAASIDPVVERVAGAQYTDPYIRARLGLD